MALSLEVKHKERLEKTFMEVKEVFNELKVVHLCFKWRIPNFSCMKKNRKYSNIGKNSGWTFTITKKIGFYSVTISPLKYNEDITCFIRYDDESLSNPIIADRSSGGVYNFTFHGSVIDVSQNKILKENCLAMDFNLSKKGVIGRPKLLSKLYDTPTLDFFRLTYEESINTPFMDFVIYTNDKALEAHKAILASRSSYFRQYIQEKCMDGVLGEIEMDTTSDVMFSILTFIYNCEITIRSREHFSKVHELSAKLGVWNLVRICNRCVGCYWH